MYSDFEPRRRDLLLAALALLGGCGGVDSGGTGTGAASTYAVGPITGFGSIIVNGVRYDDASAVIDDDNDDGRVRSSADLKLGMRAEVQASAITVSAGVSSATASSIRVHSEIVGPVEAIDPVNARLSVLGQTVDVVATTVFDASLTSGLSSLVPGDVIEVYATLDLATGRYVASRIERRSVVAAYKLRGVVGMLTLAAKTVTIGNATIDWSAVPPTDPATALKPGRRVRVMLSPTADAGVWHATALTSGVARPADRDVAEIEGRITAFTSPATFSLNGIAVDASSATFPNGNTGLALGVSVEVQGSLRGGVLIASRVQLEREDGGSEPFELHGSVESVDAAATRFVVRGVTVMWNAATLFEGGGPGSLVVGRTVEVKGVLSSDGQRIDATSIYIEA
jgi:Domain of unknown function (DUF5666)